MSRNEKNMELRGKITDADMAMTEVIGILGDSASELELKSGLVSELNTLKNRAKSLIKHIDKVIK